MRLSRHAEVRRRARGVENLSLIPIKRFGHSERSVDGAEVWIANKRERRKILRYLKAVQRNFERLDPLYLVEASNGTVITTGCRTRKIHRC